MRLNSLLLLGILWAAPVWPAQKDTIPNVSLSVTVQQKEDGKLSKGYHILHLVCWQGSCSLTATTLNQCMGAGSRNDAFFPKVERTSTSEGDLIVISVNSGELEARESTGEDEIVYRFGFEAAPKALMATRATSFSGGYVKNSIILKKVLTVEYIPLQQPFTEVKLDCAVLLPGLSQSGK